MKLARSLVVLLALAACVATPGAYAQTGGWDPTLSPLPYVHEIRTEPLVPCERVPTSLIMRGQFPDGCGTVVDQSPPGAPIELTIKVGAGPDTACAEYLKPWRVEFPLGQLRAGHHRYVITLHVIYRDSSGTGFVRRTFQVAHEFDVLADCTLVPPGELPYVRYIQIGSARVSCTPAICEGDSILVNIGGEFPNDCFWLRRIELMQPLDMSILPAPPTVRLIVDQGGCKDMVCTQRPVPWSASVTLPSLPARDYQLIVELARVNCSDIYPPGDLFRTVRPFSVRGGCRPQEPCLTAGFNTPGNVAACNATIGEGESAELTFRVAPTVALSALQGEFRLEPAGLTITKIEAIGPAKDMLLKWSAIRDAKAGANFVLLALDGAPIPPALDQAYPPGSEVLRVTVEAPPSGPPDHTVLRAQNLLGSDKDGAAVHYCEPIPCPALYPSPPRLNPPVALICARQECDFNGDGTQDVRDLVRMVRCLRSEGPCPPDLETRFDCDGDHTFALPDVICCARHILQRPPCPDCPPNQGTPRPEPSVRVSFGAPVSGDTDVRLPLRIQGADRLGAAMLTLAAPLDRYELKGVDGPAGNGWIALHEERDGGLVLGLLGGGGGAAGGALDLNLRLALKPGERPGGEVTAISGEFSGSDGEMLAVDLGVPRGALPGPEHISLSGSRPNPFSAETRFTIELAQAGHVVVGIYDLRGRLVAKLIDGPLPSGPREVPWDGRGDDGKRAADGVYFYRVEANGHTIARKLIVLRED